MKPLIIVGGIAVVTMLAFSHTALAQPVEKAKPVMDKAKAQEIFDQAQGRYKTYELEHGGWIQTKNVRMHYL